LRHLVHGRFGGWVRDFRVQVRDGGLVLRGETGTFHVKQMVQETVVAATAFRIVTNEIEVDERQLGRPAAGSQPGD